jgi:hypothetical protein
VLLVAGADAGASTGVVVSFGCGVCVVDAIAGLGCGVVGFGCGAGVVVVMLVLVCMLVQILMSAWALVVMMRW